MHQPIRHRAATALLLLLAAACSAQTPPAPTPAQSPAGGPAPAPAPTPAPAGELVSMPQLGVRFILPEGATTDTRVFTTVLTPGLDLPDGIGSIAIETQPTDREGEPLARIEARIIGRYLGLDPRRPLNPNRRIETGLGKLLGIPRSIAAPGKIIQARYVQLSSHHPLVKAGQAPIQGFAIYPTSPSSYVIFVLLTDAENIGRATLAFEQLLSTVEPALGNNASAQLDDALAAGTAFAREITADDIADAIDRVGDRFDRLYRADPGGNPAAATEQGYRQIRAYQGRRGDITDKPQGHWSNAQFEPGFVVELKARFLGTDPDTGARSITDSVSGFFLSEDRRSESWSTRMRTSSNGEITVWSMTGSRVGNNLSVRMIPDSGVGRNITPDMRMEAYLSQVESFLLPELLAAKQAPGDYAFRSYQPNLEAVTLRGHAFRKVGDDGWVIETKVADGRIQTTQLSESTGFVRTVLADGLVWDPATIESVYDLWRRKRLPLD